MSDSRNEELTADASADTSRTARNAVGGHRVWIDQPQTYSTAQVQVLKHNFHEHPLMQLSELSKLASDLYATKQCRFIAPGSNQASAFKHDPNDPSGRGIDEIFRRIEEPGSWVALYNIETHPVYREFLNEVVASVRPLVEAQEPGMFNVGGFIFISAPPSVTPFHIDRENNFWLQVKGRKTMNVWDPTDRHVVAGKVRDNFILTGSLREVCLGEGFKERSHEFNVGPGDGVYFPSTSPHMTRSDPDWTTPGDGVSISIAVVFYTEITRRSANVHALNLFLRRFGLAPTEPGQVVWLDKFKYPFGRALVWALKTLRGYEPKPGF